MNKTIKILMAILLFLALLLVIVTLSIDGFIKTEIEEQGSEILRAEVIIDDVDVSIFGGTGSISGFRIKNPEGFSDANALSFEQADMEVVLSSLLSDEIVIKELIIYKPEIFFEQVETRINLKTLQDNLNAAS